MDVEGVIGTMLGEAIISKSETTAAAYNYQDTLDTSQRVNWRIEDIIGGDK